MSSPARRRLGAAALVLAILLPAPYAEAVIPSAFGPIQALLVILPQLLVALAAAVVALFKPRTYRFLAAYLWSHKILTLVLAGLAAVAIVGPGAIFGGGAVAAERRGAAWEAFRGGPLRTGTVPGSSGPVAAPEVLWKLTLGASAAVDSSPALVGNRLYFGAARHSAFGGGSGLLAAADAETGRLVWEYDGKGDLAPPLRPVFSSPAVAAEPDPAGGPPAARFLVSGEGYHEDKNCRLVCLDLEPVRRGEPRPRLHWSVQTTSHVESSPCVFDGKAFVGAGDDGFWAVNLADGRVLWRLEGAPSYRLEGPQVEALGRLEGKTVVAHGPVRREGLGARGKDDPGELVLEPKSFREHSGPPVTASDSGRTWERAVTGRVVREGGVLRLGVEQSFPDCESSPVGAIRNGEPVVLFGTGLGGPRVHCVAARTGRVLWAVPAPYPAFGAPTVAGERVLLGTGNGNFVMSAPQPAGAILCLSLQDGRELWRVPAGDTILGAVAVHGGRAYAAARDGHLYVLEIEKGTLLAKIPVGGAMVCSPAVTEQAVYVATEQGKLFCLDRLQGGVRGSVALSPGTPVVSSPAVGEGKLFVGTRTRGLVAVGERPASGPDDRPPSPWRGLGGDPGRTGAADDRGLPAIEGDTADLREPTPEPLRRPVTAPPAACGASLYVPFADGLAQVDAATGRLRWEVPVRALAVAAAPDRVFAWTERGTVVLDAAGGRPVAGEPPVWATGPMPRAWAHNLLFEPAEGEIRCLSDVRLVRLWSTRPETAPLGAPSVAAGRVFVAAAGKGTAQGFLEARSIADGSLLWRQELDAAPISYPVASSEWVLVATADDRIAAFRAADGKARDPLPVAGRPVAPALWKDTVVLAGEGRIAAYDLAASEWLWNYKDQDHIGTPAGPPVLAARTIWVGTSKRGLVAIGVPTAQAKR
jgi:outer membrane protein assembly factor BamB